ncbi:tyrosine recombinase XerC [Tissierella sp. MSJ-40]|uniref:Tyrosine recombinase XerC n=1 Tax=Tissierella simiarum TaxID=2841534 RepID=A0ABS6E516_9FIRM|nr:tyrosine recombinase XerC [Tissierella simiarum]MBU5437631.1 tyrosine recombinase XerC [Tissierella simiarum]
MYEIPIILEDYLNYMETIKGTSPNTAKEYFFDLRTFFRFIKTRYKLVDPTVPFDEIEIDDIDLDLIKKLNIQDLHAYISYVDKKRDNGNYAKSRKVASIRSFFDYLYGKVSLIEKNPAEHLEFPKTDNRHPVYLTLEESERLLNTVLENKNEEYRKRDYAIMMLFLNCGLRLSELSSIDFDKIKNDDTLTVIGKGNKERTVFLNDGCVEAIKSYLAVRPKDSKDKKALFISKRKQRISNRAIQHMIDRYLEKAGLDTEIYSTHKLRHTAATLMYKYGNVDILALQEILGHESVSTTQIYTHIDNERLRDAIKSNPLSNRTSKSNNKEPSN